MRVRILPSATEAPGERHYLTSYLVNGSVAVDAGCLAIWGRPEDQGRVRHVFVTHTHADHLALLPVFIENACTPPRATGATAPPCVVVHGGIETIECIRADLFNGRLYPDLLDMKSPDLPRLELEVLHAGHAVQVEGLRITPVPVHHTVPTFGYLVDDGESAVVFGGDSGPTERLWDIAAANPRWKGVFLEATFPDELAELAAVSRHLTPRTFAAEVRKFPPGVEVVAVHIRPRFRDRVVAELLALGLPRLRIGAGGEEYTF